MPIFIAREVADSGWRMTGCRPRRAGSGSRREALVHELAGVHLVGAQLEDQLERRQLGRRLSSARVEPVRPVERLLHRVVISCSTSSVDIPRQSVWTSTTGGANSKMSTGIFYPERPDPHHPHRDRHDDEAETQARLMIKRIMCGQPPAKAPGPGGRSLALDRELRAEELLAADRDDLGARGGALAEHGGVALD